MPRSYLLVLGERAAIAWVLSEERMAFPSMARREVAALAQGDQLYLYATRGAWHNPTRDRGRIIAKATATSAAQALDEPIVLVERKFYAGCTLLINGLVPYPGGLELAPLVPQLKAFPKSHAWSIYLRRALLALPDRDAQVIDGMLRPLLRNRDNILKTYPNRSA
ncbi:hypothetical protein ACIA8B_19535 [Micromonospora chalcea]